MPLDSFQASPRDRVPQFLPDIAAGWYAVHFVEVNSAFADGLWSGYHGVICREGSG